jgi:hypothetical protein
LHRPWRQTTGTKNPRWVKEGEDDVAEESTSERVRVFFLGQTCFIYKHVLMGQLEQQGPNSIFGFLQCEISIEELIVSREKMRAKNKKISAKKHKVHLIFDSGACVMKREKIHSKVSKISRRYEKKCMDQIYLFS